MDQYIFFSFRKKWVSRAMGKQNILLPGWPYLTLILNSRAWNRKKTWSAIRICFGNPRIVWPAIFSFVWPSKYFLACQFPFLACHLELDTLLFCALNRYMYMYTLLLGCLLASSSRTLLAASCTCERIFLFTGGGLGSLLKQN